jgi:hypothetical protein
LNRGLLRTQISENGSALEFPVDPVSGSALAASLIEPPAGPFAVSVCYQLTSPALDKGLKLNLACMGQAQLFFDASFADRQGRFAIDRSPGCGYLLISILGRSWTGAEQLYGSITDFVIAAR